MLDVHEVYKSRQKDVVQKALKIFESHEYILGAFVSGSFAREENDAFSDIDMTVFFANEERTGLSELYEEVGQLHPTLDKMFLYDVNALYLFDNGVRLDLDMEKPSVMGTSDRSKVRILFDRNGLLDRELGQDFKASAPTKPKWNDREGNYMEWYLWMFRQAYAWAKRSKQKRSNSFDKLYGAQTSLQKIRQGIIDMRNSLTQERRYLQEVDSRLTVGIGETFVGFSADQVQESVRKLIHIFESIAPTFCARFDENYPTNKVERLKLLLNELDSSD